LNLGVDTLKRLIDLQEKGFDLNVIINKLLDKRDQEVDQVIEMIGLLVRGHPEKPQSRHRLKPKIIKSFVRMKTDHLEVGEVLKLVAKQRRRGRRR